MTDEILKRCLAKKTLATPHPQHRRVEVGGARQHTSLNLAEVQTSTYIYRIISIKRLIELFQTRQNVLVTPACWGDPFENFILNSSWQLPSGETGTFQFRSDFYGQCWTLQKASDAMWRIYSPGADGVRIRTRIDRLASSLAGTLGEWAHVQSYIGKVAYLNEAKMEQFAAKRFCT